MKKKMKKKIELSVLLKNNKKITDTWFRIPIFGKTCSDRE